MGEIYLSERVSRLKDKYIQIWEETPDTFPEQLNRYDWHQRNLAGARMSSYMGELIDLVKHFSVNSSEARHWGTALKRRLFSIGTDIIGLEDSDMRLLLEDGFCEVTADFVAQARTFDAGIKTDDIFQALRNIWIMNCIQKLMDSKIESTPSLFAYSMLYPYTDNYLDAVSVPESEKRLISRRFERRLAGDCLEPGSAYENKLSLLVDMIEQQYERSRYPMVYGCLLDIHSAQGKSLQQQGERAVGNLRDLLEISFEKGGASVLADACLVKGELTDEDAFFIFGFGIMLQLLDDLQDITIDRKRGHRTVFSRKDSGCDIESLTNKLIHFTLGVLNEDVCFNSPGAAVIKNLIKKCILFLLLEAVACNSGIYSRQYLNNLEECSTLDFSTMKSFNKKIGIEYGKLKIKLAVKPMEVLMARAFAAGRL